MHRSELEDQLGISWNKVRDIIRRSDPDNDGVVVYKGIYYRLPLITLDIDLAKCDTIQYLNL